MRLPRDDVVKIGIWIVNTLGDYHSYVKLDDEFVTLYIPIRGISDKGIRLVSRFPGRVCYI